MFVSFSMISSVAMAMGRLSWSSSILDVPLCHRDAVRVRKLILYDADDPRPEILRMSELQDSSELALYSSAVLYVLSAVTPPPEYTGLILDHFVDAIKSATVCPSVV